MIRPEFKVHMLNETGKEGAAVIADAYSALLDTIERVAGAHGRSIAIAKTKLEESCFFAKRALAELPENQVKE